MNIILDARSPTREEIERSRQREQ